MRTRLMNTIILVGVVTLLFACGGKYADAEKVYTQFADVMEAYLQDLEKADDADAVSGAINDFADEMEVLAPRMKEINAKYPELKEPENVPEKLQPIKARSDKMAMQMAGTFMKAMKYMQDAKVNAAFERLGKVMAGMGK